MSRVCTVLVLLVGLTCSVSAVAQELWKGTRAGMSVAQVQAVMPNAKATTGEKSSLDDGEIAQLEMSGIALAGTTFDAQFYFAGPKLAKVYLSPATKQDIATTRSMFADLQRGLTTKYGQPTSVKLEDKSSMFVIGSNAEWVLKDLTVTLFYLGIGKDDKAVPLHVIYEAGAAQDAKNL